MICTSYDSYTSIKVYLKRQLGSLLFKLLSSLAVPKIDYHESFQEMEVLVCMPLRVYVCVGVEH